MAAAGVIDDPLVPVLRRDALGFPEHAEDRGDYDAAVYAPLSVALTTDIEFDAHFAAYSLPGTPRRLAGHAALELRPEMVLFLVDVEPAGHAPVTPEWWAAERAKLDLLLAAFPGGLVYSTRGGYRVVYRLATPLLLDSRAATARWTASYKAWLDDLESGIGIVGDRACADWTRLYRLPRVVRDGVAQSPEVIGDPFSVGAWPVEYVDPPASEFGDAPASSGEPSEYGPASPELLEHARWRLQQHGPAVEGQGGHKHTRVAWGILVNDLALSTDEARPLMLEWNSTCSPPWSEEELFSKPAREYGQSWNGPRGEAREAHEIGRRLTSLRAPATTAPEPTEVTLRSSLEAARDRWRRSTNAGKKRDGNLLAIVLRDELISDTAELCEAATAAWRAAPAGTTRDQVREVLQSKSTLPSEDLAQIVELAEVASARSTASGESAELLGEFVLSKKSGDEEGHPVPSNAHNMRLACAKLGVEFKHDRFANHEIMVRGDDQVIVQDEHVNALAFEIERAFGFFPPVDKFYRFCSTAAREHSFHPVLDYIDGLPAWDGVPRVETWLVDLAGAQDTPFVRAISRMFLVAAVRRIRRPGCKFDEMLILETPDQGKFKSKALRALAVRDEWFSDDFELDADRRELMESTDGVWIIEAGELKGFGNKDHNKFKAYLSRQEDRARLAYGRKTHRRKREFVVFGTTNDEQYLSDPTGNRRYLPVRVVEFDVPRLIAVREQLWAEAAALDLAHPEDSYIRLDPSLYKAAAAEQEKRRTQDSIHVELADALADVTGHIRVQDVWKLLGFSGDKRPTKAQEQSICSAMRVLGWENLGQRHMHGIRGTYYARGTDAERKVPVSVKSEYGIPKVDVGRPVSPTSDTVNQGSALAPQGTN